MQQAGMTWEGARGAHKVFGDQGPWTWYLAEAWQHAAAPDLFAGVSRRPEDQFLQLGDNADRLALDIAYWSPLLHLTTYGLGWGVPELGLWKWLQQGQPTDDPVLSAIKARYAENVDLMMTWLTVGGGGSHRQAILGSGGESQVPTELPLELRRHAHSVRSSARYEKTFSGGGDPLHLFAHLLPSTAPSDPLLESFTASQPAVADHLLVSDTYGALFAALRSETVPATRGGRSTRVALVCPSIGHLGIYRRSRQTGRWFRGRHRWHELGN